MIDPNSIIICNNNKDNVINITNLNDFDSDIPVYDLNQDDKDFKKYIHDIESCVRKSYEYKIFCKYLRENFGMDHCAYLSNVSNQEDPSLKIEIHHTPFSLYDIVMIVFRKRQYNHESLSVFMVAEEVLQLHYQLLVGLIPLSETVHQLVHAGRLFVPVNKIMGRYKLFVDIYYPFIDPEQLDSLHMIERATDENSEVGDTTILNTNRIHYNISDKRYQLPQIANISDDMINRLDTIKQNNYILPTVTEAKQIESRNKNLYCPIHFKSVE